MFSAAASYTFMVVIRDRFGETVSSEVAVTVESDAASTALGHVLAFNPADPHALALQREMRRDAVR